MRVLLAPMEGVVDHHLRFLLSRIGGIDQCVTEFIRVTEHTLPRKVFLRYSPELLYRQQGSLERSSNSLERSSNSLERLSSSPERLSSSPDRLSNSPEQPLNSPEQPLNSPEQREALPKAAKGADTPNTIAAHQHREDSVPHLPSAAGALCPTKVQLLGSNPATLADNAYRAAQLGAPGVDLNFGCPAKTVNRNRGGACLLKEPQTIFKIVSSVRKRVPEQVPVSAKIRLGFDQRDNYLDNAKAIFDAGADELVVHARSKSDGYKPPAYWECIAEIREHIPINVVANGEIWTLEDYQRCRQLSGCADVMLGRGLLATPDLALQIKAYLAGTPYTPCTWSAIAEILLEFLDITTTVYAAKYTGNRVKQWLFYLSRSYPQAEALFENIKRIRDYPALREALSASAAA